MIFQFENYTNERVLRGMDEFFEKWRNTKYLSGQCVCQVGTDCLRFLVAFLEEAQGKRMPNYDELPSDAYLHDGAITRKVMRQIFKCYGPAYRVKPPIVQPGDIIVQGAKGPGHARIVGTEQGRIWEATGSGVCQTGFILTDKKLHAIYRIRNKDKWYS